MGRSGTLSSRRCREVAVCCVGVGFFSRVCLALLIDSRTRVYSGVTLRDFPRRRLRRCGQSLPLFNSVTVTSFEQTSSALCRTFTDLPIERTCTSQTLDAIRAPVVRLHPQLTTWIPCTDESGVRVVCRCSSPVFLSVSLSGIHTAKSCCPVLSSSHCWKAASVVSNQMWNGWDTLTRNSVRRTIGRTARMNGRSFADRGRNITVCAVCAAYFSRSCTWYDRTPLPKTDELRKNRHPLEVELAGSLVAGKTWRRFGCVYHDRLLRGRDDEQRNERQSQHSSLNMTKSRDPLPYRGLHAVHLETTRPRTDCDRKYTGWDDDDRVRTGRTKGIDDLIIQPYLDDCSGVSLSTIKLHWQVFAVLATRATYRVRCTSPSTATISYRGLDP